MGDRSRTDWPSNSKEYRAAEWQKTKASRSIYDKERYAKNRARYRANDRKRRYGIEQEDYDRMYAAQGGKCAICGVPSEELQHALSVDHHHSCDGIRGLLCHKCNRGLGLFKDNPELLEIAKRYLGEHNCAS